MRDGKRDARGSPPHCFCARLPCLGSYIHDLTGLQCCSGPIDAAVIDASAPSIPHFSSENVTAEGICAGHSYTSPRCVDSTLNAYAITFADPWLAAETY